ncbi:hypothetical protein SPRG_05278 [Saprolegnia parasitica CBS 223.65]|uniref:Uncharacterized protein n=1 Tax=Saprolegnia parasitica (strain CBS 223.65) TaxID=695850 RepID=A0A067CTH7_SAPPC|nr:hypothetical protein SPRG_05278 [Saprolegnia parasitica CBS 223.65]KDO30087.1 hypothetical protein SPRG_05278 [Saprolegnia parasitica CBS 223.65]|eukprot:XP_012199268.1 hypothetical protein SPRG_05278 [Saprolegnia parasitica CBS 223.65]
MLALDFKDLPKHRPCQYEKLKKTPSTWKSRVAALERAKRREPPASGKLRVPRPPSLTPDGKKRHGARGMTFTEADRAHVAIDASLDELLQPLDDDGLKKIPMHLLPDMHTLLAQRQRRRNPLDYIKHDHVEVMWLHQMGGSHEGLDEYRAWRVAHGHTILRR